MITEFNVKSLIHFIRAAKITVLDLFPSNQFRALQYEERLSANGRVMIPLLHKMKANISDSGLLTNISIYEVDAVAVLLRFA